MYHLPYLYDKQDRVQSIKIKEVEEFHSVFGELPSGFRPEFPDFVRNFMPDNVTKTSKNLPEALKLYLFLPEEIDQCSRQLFM